MNSRMTVAKKLALVGGFLIVLTVALWVSTLIGLASFSRILAA
jgi:hypothetical protein